MTCAFVSYAIFLKGANAMKGTSASRARQADALRTAQNFFAQQGNAGKGAVSWAYELREENGSVKFVKSIPKPKPETPGAGDTMGDDSTPSPTPKPETPGDTVRDDSNPTPKPETRYPGDTVGGEDYSTTTEMFHHSPDVQFDADSKTITLRYQGSKFHEAKFKWNKKFHIYINKTINKEMGVRYFLTKKDDSWILQYYVKGTLKFKEAKTKKGARRGSSGNAQMPKTVQFQQHREHSAKDPVKDFVKITHFNEELTDLETLHEGKMPVSSMEDQVEMKDSKSVNIECKFISQHQGGRRLIERMCRATRLHSEH